MRAAGGGRHPKVDMPGGISAAGGGTKVPAHKVPARSPGRDRNGQPVWMRDLVPNNGGMRGCQPPGLESR
jgi:hypothetical protein